MEPIKQWVSWMECSITRRLRAPSRWVYVLAGYLCKYPYTMDWASRTQKWNTAIFMKWHNHKVSFRVNNVWFPIELHAANTALRCPPSHFTHITNDNIWTSDTNTTPTTTKHIAYDGGIFEMHPLQHCWSAVSTIRAGNCVVGEEKFDWKVCSTKPDQKKKKTATTDKRREKIHFCSCNC